MPKVTQHTSSRAGIRTQACLTLDLPTLTGGRARSLILKFSLSLALTLSVQSKRVRYPRSHLRHPTLGFNLSIASSQVVYDWHRLLAKCSEAGDYFIS